MRGGIIHFNETKARQFERAYERAARNKVETFEFEGRELLTAFAHYVVEHLRNEGLLTKH